MIAILNDSNLVRPSVRCAERKSVRGLGAGNLGGYAVSPSLLECSRSTSVDDAFEFLLMKFNEEDVRLPESSRGPRMKSRWTKPAHVEGPSETGDLEHGCNDAVQAVVDATSMRRDSVTPEMLANPPPKTDSRVPGAREAFQDGITSKVPSTLRSHRN